jgi:hypothetical protein
VGFISIPTISPISENRADFTVDLATMTITPDGENRLFSVLTVINTRVGLEQTLRKADVHFL